MNILQAIEENIGAAKNRMESIRIEQAVLKNEYGVVSDHKWELEKLRDIAIKAEAERKDDDKQ